MHRLVDAAAFGDEPVVDAAERGQDLSADTGFFGDLADRGFLGVSPCSMWPFGSDHSIRPRRSIRPMRAAT